MVKARIEVRMILEILFRKEKEKVRFDQLHEPLTGMGIRTIRIKKIILMMIKTKNKILQKTLKVMNLMTTAGLTMKQMNKNNLITKNQW